MKILHTSDWHLGKKTERVSRLPEQRAVLAEITRIAEQHAVDAIVVAGDIFDTFSPPSEAEELFYDALIELARVATVFVIAGNHDDARRLCAADPLAVRSGIFLLGSDGASFGAAKGGGFELVDAGKGYLCLQKDGQRLNLAYLPYPTPPQLDRLLEGGYDESAGFSANVGRCVAEATRCFCADGVNLLVSHIFVRGAARAGDEAEIELGTARLIEPSHLPAADYIALGHIHGFQRPTKTAVYSGSILQYSFDDTAPKSVTVVELEAGKEAVLRNVRLVSGKRLVRLTARSLEQAEQLLPAHADDWVELTLELDRPITGQENRALSARYPQVVKRRIVLPEREEEDSGTRRSMSLPELFGTFYRSQTGGEPSEALVALFLELMEEGE